MAKSRQGWRPDRRPARARYWRKRSLEKNKVKNLIRHNGMTRDEALKYWRKQREGRVKDGYL